MNKEFCRCRSVRDIVVSTVFIVAGIALLLIPTNIGISILGACFALIGLILILTLRTNHKDMESGICYKMKSKYYHSSRKEEILKALASKPESVNWDEEPNAEGLRLDIYYNSATNKVFAICHKYIPYEYLPCSDWFCIDMDKSGNLTK